jgi:hypothetical protein
METIVRHRPSGRIAYLRGKPASQWIDATSKRRRHREQAPRATARP